MMLHVPPFYYCESTFIRWHQFSWFLQNALFAIDPCVLEFVVSHTTVNNQWENCNSFDFSFCGLSEPQNPRKLEPYD